MKRKKHLKYKDLPKMLKFYIDKDFSHCFGKRDKNFNPTLRHIIKKVKERDDFHAQLCAEMPELAPLMRRREKEIKALEAYLSAGGSSPYPKIKTV